MLTVDDGRFHFTPKDCVDVSSGRTCIRTVTQGCDPRATVMTPLESPPTRYISTLGGTRAWFVQHHRANSSWHCEVCNSELGDSQN